MTIILAKVAVAAAVQKVAQTPELAMAERELRALMAKRAAIQHEICVTTDRVDFPSRFKPPTEVEEDAMRARITELTAQLKILDAETSAARRTIDQHQPVHAAAVRKALAPLRRGHAEKVIAAIRQFQVSAAGLQETGDELERAGCRITRLPLPPYLDGVVEIARSIVSAESELI